MPATLALRRRRFLQATAGLAMLPAAARARVCATPPTAEKIGQAVTEAQQRYAGLTDGKNADYIPYLAGIPSTLFGVAASAPDGTVKEAGDVGYALAIEFIAEGVHHGPRVAGERAEDRSTNSGRMRPGCHSTR